MATKTQASTGPWAKLSGLPWATWLLLIGGGVLAFRPLVPTWNDNLNYSFGWWIPLVSALLLFERWPSRPQRDAAGPFSLTPLLVAWGVIYLAFRVVAEADPDWRPGLWVLIGLYIASVLGWLRLYGGGPWLRHFAFPVFFLLLSLPWFFEIEYPVVQGLMRWNAILVADSLQALAITAEPDGNIIQMEHCQLGVEEACSGILSLQASLMMGCLLGEIYRLTLRRRFVLPLVSMLLALIGNYLRTFFLALVAFYSGSDAVADWHDTAGFAILVFTALGSWLAAHSLDIGKVVKVTPSVPVKSPKSGGPWQAQTRTARRFVLVIFGMTVLAEAVTQAWYGWKETSLSRHPEWSAQFPTTDGFKELRMSEVTLAALRSDLSRAGQWRDARGWEWTVYWLRYDPKPYTRTVLGWHIPDNCLPSVGLTKDRDYPAFTSNVGGIDFYIQPKRFHSKDSPPLYLFWVVYPLRGDRPDNTDTRITPPFASKLRSHFHDVLTGNRGVGVETLELAVTGPANYEEAKAAYLTRLNAMIIPGRH